MNPFSRPTAFRIIDSQLDEHHAESPQRVKERKTGIVNGEGQRIDRRTVRTLSSAAGLIGAAFLFSLLAGGVARRYRQGDRDADEGADGEMMGALREKGQPRWVGRALELLGKASSTRPLGPAATLTSVVLARRHPRAALFLFLTTATTLAAQRLVKTLVRRPRPEEQRTDDGKGSFPSGHGTLTAALALTASLIAEREFPESQGRVKAVVLPLALLVSASRPLLRQHYPSDVLAGDALGVAGVLAHNLWYQQGQEEPQDRRRDASPVRP